MKKRNADLNPDMPYVRCGRSGLKLSRVAFGLWHNFGSYDDPANMRELVRCVFIRRPDLEAAEWQELESLTD